VVHDVVGQDHRGEDRVAADEAGAESVGRRRRVRGLCTRTRERAISLRGRLAGRAQCSTADVRARREARTLRPADVPADPARQRSTRCAAAPPRAGLCSWGASSRCMLPGRGRTRSARVARVRAPTHRVHACEERLHLRGRVEARLVGELRRLLLLRTPHNRSGAAKCRFRVRGKRKYC